MMLEVVDRHENVTESTELIEYKNNSIINR